MSPYTFGDDYPPAPPSPRHRAAQEVWGLLAGFALAQGDGPERSPEGKCWIVHFRREGVFSGTVQVYGPEWFAVSWKARREPWTPAGQNLYDDPTNLLAFLLLAFVDCDPDSAARVPQKQGRVEANSHA